MVRRKRSRKPSPFNNCVKRGMNKEKKACKRQTSRSKFTGGCIKGKFKKVTKACKRSRRAY